MVDTQKAEIPCILCLGRMETMSQVSPDRVQGGDVLPAVDEDWLRTLATLVKDNKKCFCKYIHNKRRAKESVRLY